MRSDQILKAISKFVIIFDTFKLLNQQAYKFIRAVLIVFGALYLYDLYKNYQLFTYALKDGSEFFFPNILMIFPYIYLPIALIIFGLRKHYGWILFAAYLAFCAIGVLWGLLSLSPPLIPQLMSLLLYAGTLVLISRESIRQVYAVTKNQMIMSIVIPVILAALVIFYLNFTTAG